jgi:DNA-binding NarL/FixJ family response regulator
MRHNLISRASNGECADRFAMAVKCANEPVRTLAAKLTGAENRVLAHVTRAKTNKEIARDLAISPATVKRHLENVLSKLGLKNRVEAAIYGLMVNGCSGGMNSGCALQVWHKERETAESIWAD